MQASVAALAGQALPVLVLANLHRVFMYLFMYGDDKSSQASLMYLHSLTKTLPNQLLQSCILDLLLEVVKTLGDEDAEKRQVRA